MPGTGSPSPDSLTSMHFSSPMKSGCGGTLPGSNPEPSFQNPSVGSKCRPLLTDQCVGCFPVRKIVKSVSCQVGTQVALDREHGCPVVGLCNDAST